MRKHQQRLLNRENILGVALGIIVFASVVAIAPHIRRAKLLGDHADERVIAFDPPSYNFGAIAQSENVRHTFRLINRGTDTLRIVGIRTSCQCTLVDTRASIGESIPPKGSVAIPVEFNSESHEGLGKARIEALVERAGERLYAAAFIEAMVEPEYTVQPRAVHFGMARPGCHLTQSVTISAASSKALTLKIPEPSPPLKLLLSTNANKPRVRILSITLETPTVSHSQLYADSIMIGTPSTRLPVLKIPVDAIIQPECEISPETVVITDTTARGESRFTLRSAEETRVVRALVRRNGRMEQLELSASEDRVWGSLHTRTLSNAFLNNAEEIHSELEARNAMGRLEVRSVSAQITHL
jgi:Protein of unknown function (DUF1573)